MHTSHTLNAGVCFNEPADALRTIVGAIGIDARLSLLEKAACAWADEVPENELSQHYAKAINGVSETGLEVIVDWFQNLGHPVFASREVLIGAFPSLGAEQRSALRLAAGLRSLDAVEAGINEEDALDLVIPMLSEQKLMQLAHEAVQLYLWDHVGSAN